MDDQRIEERELWLVGRAVPPDTGRPLADDSVLVWQFCSHDTLPTWVIGNLIMLCDTCHPMLPYTAPGGAQGIKDVWVLHLAPRAERIRGLVGLYHGVLHYPAEP